LYRTVLTYKLAVEIINYKLAGKITIAVKVCFVLIGSKRVAFSSGDSYFGREK
jgi:hypothetical protein